MRVPLVLLTNPSLPAKTFPEFIAYAKANPGKVNMAKLGTGTPLHVASELLKMLTTIEVVEVPYHVPAQVFTDLIAGQVQASINTVPASMGFITTGKLRALAVTSATRLAVLPGIPAMAEFAPGYEATAWGGMGAPRNTPAAIIDELNRTINAGLADLQIKGRLKDLGSDPMPLTSAEFGTFIAEETEKWAKVIKFAGIKPE